MTHKLIWRDAPDEGDEAVADAPCSDSMGGKPGRFVISLAPRASGYILRLNGAIVGEDRACLTLMQRAEAML